MYVLDNYNHETRQTLLDALEDNLRDAVALTMILVSGRDDQDIVCTHGEYPSLRISLNKTIRDIEACVRAGTEHLMNKGLLLRQNQAKREMQVSIVDRMSAGADGTYIL